MWYAVSKSLRDSALPILTLVVIGGVWEAVTRSGMVAPFLLPAPSVVLSYAAGHLDVLWFHAQVTILESVAGFALAVVAGIAIAIAMISSSRFERAILPILITSQVVPKVAIAPLVVIWMGFGQEPKVFLAFLVSFFPMVINAALGMRSVDPELLELLASLRLSRWQILWKVRWFTGLPAIVEASKVTVTLAIIGALVGEFAAGNRGLGFLVLSSAASSNLPLSFATLFTLIVIGIVMYQVLAVVGRALTPWVRRSNQAAIGVTGL